MDVPETWKGKKGSAGMMSGSAMELIACLMCFFAVAFYIRCHGLFFCFLHISLI